LKLAPYESLPPARQHSNLCETCALKLRNAASRVIGGSSEEEKQLNVKVTLLVENIAIHKECSSLAASR